MVQFLPFSTRLQEPLLIIASLSECISEIISFCAKYAVQMEKRKMYVSCDINFPIDEASALLNFDVIVEH